MLITGGRATLAEKLTKINKWITISHFGIARDIPNNTNRTSTGITILKSRNIQSTITASTDSMSKSSTLKRMNSTKITTVISLERTHWMNGVKGTRVMVLTRWRPLTQTTHLMRGITRRTTHLSRRAQTQVKENLAHPRIVIALTTSTTSSIASVASSIRLPSRLHLTKDLSQPSHVMIKLLILMPWSTKNARTAKKLFQLPQNVL